MNCHMYQAERFVGHIYLGSWMGESLVFVFSEYLFVLLEVRTSQTLPTMLHCGMKGNLTRTVE